MTTPDRHSNLLIARLCVLIVVVLFAASCGSDGGGGSALDLDESDLVGTRMIDPERQLSFEDFKTVGFKKNTKYDVSELREAQEAYFGFWGIDPYDRKDFELRIYASQSDAIAHGTKLASERTWPNELLTKDTANWLVGIDDARKCQGVQGMGFATCDVPKYYDYMFVGNVILFCPGASLAVAKENCDELVTALNQ
ncbi:MAG: hypothetical protein HN926_04165 [Chloroflexi bacterium]|nr:hypothetical protein [Chloroflexota bacterium]MBT4142730.1 hypothetical protein [Chloroflexota bacterium]MBT6706695.1 hypothetical protein [Chloroflexota bacterium]MBT7003691.1 hypothetical protein [Chloroflexota bacterium]MBT7078542.1 hypothetical protein [Chloroflexota bacterium]